VCFASTTTLKAQDPAVTALSVMGVVSDLKQDTRQVIVKTAAGSEVIDTLSESNCVQAYPAW
jgi:hypothetical protein